METLFLALGSQQKFFYSYLVGLSGRQEGAERCPPALFFTEYNGVISQPPVSSWKHLLPGQFLSQKIFLGLPLQKQTILKKCFHKVESHVDLRQCVPYQPQTVKQYSVKSKGNKSRKVGVNAEIFADLA